MYVLVTVLRCCRCGWWWWWWVVLLLLLLVPKNHTAANETACRKFEVAPGTGTLDLRWKWLVRLQCSSDRVSTGINYDIIPML